MSVRVCFKGRRVGKQHLRKANQNSGLGRRQNIVLLRAPVFLEAAFWLSSINTRTRWRRHPPRCCDHNMASEPVLSFALWTRVSGGEKVLVDGLGSIQKRILNRVQKKAAATTVRANPHQRVGNLCPATLQ